MNSCTRFCCWLFCCRTEKSLPLQSLDDQTRLLPKNPYTKGIFEQNELHCYGFICKENTQDFLLEKYIDKNDFIKKISVGDNQILILFDSGKLGVLGDNDNGQLGLPLKRGENENKYNDLLVYKPKISEEIDANSYQIIDVACGEHFSLILIAMNNKNKHYLYKLGYHQDDRYRDDIETISPISLVKLDYENVNIKRIFAFGQRSLFYSYKNEIYVGELDFKMNPLRKYKHIHTMTTPIHEVTMGSEHCLILDERGSLFAIGDNTYGEIGIEDSINTDKVVEIKFFLDNNIAKISKITAGARNSLVLLKDGDLFAFGDNSDGQCTGFSTRYAVPTKIVFEKKEKIIDIFCGYNHCMILLQNGDLYGWGDNTSGKLILKDAQSIDHPKPIHILKGKCINNIALGVECSVISTSEFERSIVFRETQPIL